MTGEFTLNSPLTKEDWDKIADAELEKTKRVWFKTPSGKCAEFIPVSVIDDIKAEIKEWYWQADKQAIAKDPCVVDAMVDLFIRTINKHISGGKDG